MGIETVRTRTSQEKYLLAYAGRRSVPRAQWTDLRATRCSFGITSLCPPATHAFSKVNAACEKWVDRHGWSSQPARSRPLRAPKPFAGNRAEYRIAGIVSLVS